MSVNEETFYSWISPAAPSFLLWGSHSPVHPCCFLRQHRRDVLCCQQEKEKWEEKTKLIFVLFILHWHVRTHWCHRWVKPLKWERNLFLSLFGSCIWNKTPQCGLCIMRNSSAWDKRCDQADFKSGAELQCSKFEKKTLLSFIWCFCSTSSCLNSSTWGF